MDEQKIFSEALELSDPLKQRDYLDKACAGNEQLRMRIERLLQLSQSDGSFMEEPLSLLAGPANQSQLTATFDSDANKPASSAVPDAERDEHVIGGAIGPYTLLQKLGEGGMGTVFMAEQTEPVNRRVALKVIKQGLNSQAILSRFEAERHALSLMDHPNIARVLDAGRTDDGKPYFVMELVKGVPIHNYCDAHRLDTHQRLQLFKPVCLAVQHAHQKGIVHRDIKPSNVLVAQYDDQATPKVIDFGIAKALHQTLTDATLHTQVGQIIGTLEYMSPEQARVNQVDVDTRSDIYSLGVLLYEILTGSPPHDRNRLRRAELNELVRIIQDETPPLPSQRLSRNEAMPEIAASRATSPARLSTIVRGDLDWIVMKALDKDRNRRYQTCTSLVEDIDRYLNNQPVSACPPSAFYLISKFVRRNRALASASVLVLMSMLAATVTTSWGMYKANQARLAERKRVELEQQSTLAAIEAQKHAESITAEKIAALEREQQQRIYAEAITRFVRDDFLALTSVEGQVRFGDLGTAPLGKDATLQDLLQRAANKLEERKDLAPHTQATLRWMIGVNYRGMGLFQQAADQLKMSSDLFRQALGDEHDETLRARNEWALAELKCGNRQHAIELLQTILTTQRKLGHPASEPVLTTMNNLGCALQENGQFNEAIELFQKICEARTSLPEENLDRLRSQNNLADSYRAAGRVKEAIPLHQKTHEIRSKILPKDDPRVIQSIANLALCYLEDGQLDKALPLHEEAAQRMSAVLETSHPDLLIVKNNIANGFQSAGRYTQALEMHQQIYEARRKLLGEHDSATLTTLSDMAESLRLSGDFRKALELHERALAGRRATLPQGHISIIESLNNLAICCQLDERFLQAETHYQECLRLMRTIASNPNHPSILSVANNLALCQAELGHYHEAIKSLQAIVAAREATIPTHPLTFSTMHNLAECQILKGPIDSGVELLTKTLALRRKHLPEGHPDVLESLALLGKTECDQGRIEAGLPRLSEVAAKVNEYPTLWPVRDEIRSILWKQNQREKLREQCLVDLALARQVLQADQLRLAQALAAIAKDLLSLGHTMEAQPLIDESLELNRVHGPDHPRIAAVESLKARCQIDLCEAGEAQNRAEVLNTAQRRLDECYRIQAARVKQTPTRRFYDELQDTVDQLVRVSGMLGLTDRHQQWQSAQAAVTAARKNFGDR